MSFTIGTFGAIEKSNSGSPSVYSYRTEDTLAEVSAASYFDNAIPAPVDGDIIIVVASDGVSNMSSNGSGGAVSGSSAINASCYVDATSGTPVIQKAFNVSSITDSGVGNYIVNFTAALDSTNYCWAGSAANPVGNFNVPVVHENGAVARTTTSLPVMVGYGNPGVAADLEFSVIVTGA